MTLRDIVNLVATKRGLQSDNTYTATLLDLAKQRARQVWESYDWDQRLYTHNVEVEELAEYTGLTPADFPDMHSVVSLKPYEEDFELEPQSLTNFARRHTAGGGDAGMPTRYALRRTSQAHGQEYVTIVWDRKSPRAWFVQVLYRLELEAMFAEEDITDGDIILPGAATVLEHHIEADSLEMDEQRGAAERQRGMALSALAQMQERTQRSPAHQRVLPAVNFTDSD